MFDNLTGKLVTTIATALVSAACGWAVKAGYIDQSQVESTIGSVVFLIGVGFAVLERKSSHDASTAKIADAQAVTATVVASAEAQGVTVGSLPPVQTLKG